MTTLILPLPGSEALANNLLELLSAQHCACVTRVFPDGEHYVRVETPVAGRDVVIVAGLAHPDDKLVLLYLLARTLSDLGARRILLVAPYLPYMRQDSVFQPGEGRSAEYISSWLSGFIDGLVTVDPHLHRIGSLKQVFSVPAEAVHAAQVIAHWIGENVTRPMIVGPDEESRQWSKEVAQAIEAPLVVLHKTRHGDRDVTILTPDLPSDTDYTPVLVDDIISTGQTLVAAIRQLRNAGFPAPVCVGVHALFTQDVIDQLRSAGAERVVSCNTVPHASNAIDTSRPIAAALRRMLAADV
ncbi:MAG TPA: ribose-phosphate diphosphokinase [Solimonas sp.]|nr:ribose-phosphate diphosphokinase [Solimonas sp.]